MKRPSTGYCPRAKTCARDNARPRLNLFEKARVFNSDYGLVRKGIDKLDLTFGERADFCAPDEYYANCLASVDQRYAQNRANAGLKSQSVANRENLDLRERVGEMHWPQLRHAASSCRSCDGQNTIGGHRNGTVVRRDVEIITHQPVDRHIGAAALTSAVAVCCFKLSCSSIALACSASNSRVFSMACAIIPLVIVYGIGRMLASIIDPSSRRYALYGELGTIAVEGRKANTARSSLRVTAAPTQYIDTRPFIGAWDVVH